MNIVYFWTEITCHIYFCIRDIFAYESTKIYFERLSLTNSILLELKGNVLIKAHGL